MSSLLSYSKKRLNKISHSVRASQAVLQYGVGAMVDFPDQTLMTATPSSWADSIVRIYDERLSRSLNVSFFGMPGGSDLAHCKDGISYTRFPEWYFCPKCRRFQPMSKWVQEYRRKGNAKWVELDPHMTRNPRCSTCRQDLVPARIVTACAKGHISDFPWISWVHRQNHGSSKDICNAPALLFKSGNGTSEGLNSMTVICTTCKAQATLAKAFSADIFPELDEKHSCSEFRCRGHHPHNNTRETCYEYPKTLQRGSSSVYFPVTVSSLVIPPYAEHLTGKIEQSKVFEGYCTVLAEEDTEEDRINKITKKLSEWSDKIAKAIGAKAADVEIILRRKWLDNMDETSSDVGSIEYRAEEYAALTGLIKAPTSYTGDFSRVEMDVTQYDIPALKSIALIEKIREVRAFIGFTRLEPCGSSNAFDSPNFVCIKEESDNWYPGYEVRGEGVFIEFDNAVIEKWIEANPIVLERAQRLNENYNTSFLGQATPRLITPKFILLHTLSHLLIKQLSFECGYSIASLRERIYCGDTAEHKNMTGIFLYTASGDSEGTLGGLVRQGYADTFPQIFKKAIQSASICSNDPVCNLSQGQGRDSLNLAACHSCTLIPETSCEEFNVFLDRSLIIGTFENPELGFYSNL